jgi:hypothetical protein
MSMTQPPQTTNTGTTAGASTVPGVTEVRGRVGEPTSFYEPTSTGWTGWITFAAVMMVILGIFHAIAGFVALFKEDYYQVGDNDLVVSVNYDAWGWVHIAVGALIIAAGASLFSRHMFGRIAAVVIASLSAIYNVAFLAAYPIWTVTMIAIDILVIWAVIVHGREVAAV